MRRASSSGDSTADKPAKCHFWLDILFSFRFRLDRPRVKAKQQKKKTTKKKLWREEKSYFHLECTNTHRFRHGAMLACGLWAGVCVYVRRAQSMLWRNVMSRKNWNFNWILKTIFRFSRSSKFIFDEAFCCLHFLTEICLCFFFAVSF